MAEPNIHIEICKEKVGTGIIMRVSGTEIIKTKAYDPAYNEMHAGTIDFIKFPDHGNAISIIIGKQEISIPKDMLAKALEFVIGKKKGISEN